VQLNPDLLFASEGSPELLSGVAERLEAAAHWLAPLSIIGFTIEDVGLDGRIPQDRLDRMKDHARRVILGAVRSEENGRRRVTDALFRVGSMYFVVLYNANRENYLVPLVRIIERLRQEAYAVLGTTGASYRRRIVIGAATWLPKHGMLSPEAAIGRVLEAMMMAHVLPPSDEAYARLGIVSSSSDEIRLHEYGWDEALYELEQLKGKLGAAADAAEKAPEARKAAAKTTEKPKASSAIKVTAKASTTKPAGKKAATRDQLVAQPSKPWWQFWKK